MELLTLTMQVAIAAGIMNVWLFRHKKPTRWRAGQAQNMTEEFAAYGLPPSVMWGVGIAKLSLAALLVAGLWWPAVTQPAAAAMAAMMLGAVLMHVKVKDPLKKSVPALSLLVLSVTVLLLS